MTTNCPTCEAAGYDPLGDPVPPPATSTAWARRQAIAAAREAVDRARRTRATPTPPGAAGTGHNAED